MKTKELLIRLTGLQTTESIQNILKVNKEKATYYVYRLKKHGYVKTSYGSNKKRIYNINKRNILKGTTYTDIINRYGPIKLVSPRNHYIYGKEPSIEELIIFAIKKREVRYVTASLALFRKVKDWPKLYNLAKKEGLTREIAALYEVSRLVVRKVKSMPKRFKTLALPKKEDKYRYIVQDLDSSDFKTIEKKWKVYIPLNYADLEDYR